MLSQLGMEFEQDIGFDFAFINGKIRVGNEVIAREKMQSWDSIFKNIVLLWKKLTRISSSYKNTIISR